MIAALGAALRPWHHERELFSGGGHTLVVRVLGNAFGSRCELEELGNPGVTIPFACGVYGVAPDFGPAELVRTEGRETCVVQLAPLRELACVPGYVEHMFVAAEYVALTQYAGGATRVIEIDRETGLQSRFRLPPTSYLDGTRTARSEPVVYVPGPPVSVFRLARGGLVSTTP